MNEELKIIIKAVTSEAEKNLEGVRKELEKVSQTANETSQILDKALSTIGKGAIALIGSITALSTALNKLGQTAQNVNKGFERLKSSFENAGSTAKEATKYYKELFGVLGDHDRAVEAGQSIARITTDPGALNDYKNIIAGGVSAYGEGYNAEMLAENISETIAAAKVTGDLERVLVEAGISAEGFNATLAQISSAEEREILIRNTLNGILGNAGKAYIAANQTTIQYNRAQADLNIALSRTSAYLTPLLTAVTNLGSAMLTGLAPAIEIVSLYLTAFIQLIVEAIQWIGNFFGLFDSSTEQSTSNIRGYQEAMSQYMQDLGDYFGTATSGMKETEDQAKALKKQLMGFDELNVVGSQTISGGASGGGIGGGGGAMPTAPNPADFGLDSSSLQKTMDEYNKKLDEAKAKIKSIIPIVLAVVGGLLLWKLADFLTELAAAKKIIKNMEGNKYFFQKVFGEKAQQYLDDINSKMRYLGGLLLIVAGAILLVKGFSDAWINGLDWGNLATMLGGIGLIVGGIALAFGPMAAAISLATGGIVLMVIGIKDLITNGYSLEAVLTVAAGAIAVVIGVIWAFNAALLASPITWIILAIIALVAIFVILWNECEGFRNFFIDLWEKIKVAFNAFIETCKPGFEAMKNAFAEIWETIKVVWGKVVEKFKAAWEDIKVIWNYVKPYFQMVWNNIKAIFSVVVEVLGSFFRNAWEAIKAVWSVVVSFFRAIWDTIAGIFSVVRNVLEGNWKEAWEAIKRIVSSWQQYFQDKWNAIKKIFGAVGSFFKDSFGSAWEGIKKIFNNVGTFFSGIWDKIKSIFSKVGSAIGDAVSKAFSSAINWVLEKGTNIINGFIKAINFAIGVINAIPGVNIKKLELLEVPKLATGGITTGATMAMIGERGKEAVLPLENNTGWMDMLADRIASRNNTPSKIVLMIDGKELGWASINNINNITKQTGGLQLHLV